jgi:hypothetical protein
MVSLVLVSTDTLNQPLNKRIGFCNKWAVVQQKKARACFICHKCLFLVFLLSVKIGFDSKKANLNLVHP